jgi:hypothetical protein
MRVEVKVIPNAKRNEVLEGKERFKVYVSSPPVGGKANKALIELLATYFKVKKNKIRIIKGEHSRVKIVEIV